MRAEQQNDQVFLVLLSSGDYGFVPVPAYITDEQEVCSFILNEAPAQARLIKKRLLTDAELFAFYARDENLLIPIIIKFVAPETAKHMRFSPLTNMPDVPNAAVRKELILGLRQELREQGVQP